MSWREQQDGGSDRGQVSKLRERNAEACKGGGRETERQEKKGKNPREAKAIRGTGLINVTPFRVILMANVRDRTYGRLMFLNTHKGLHDFLPSANDF